MESDRAVTGHRGAGIKHAAVVDPVVWRRVQAMLKRNGRAGGTPAPNKFGALLKGIIRYVPCACAMTPTHSTRGDQLSQSAGPGGR